MIKFDIKKPEHEMVRVLAAFAYTAAKENGVDYPVQDAMMDIEATHLNGCKLKLKEMVAAIKADNNYDLIHDLFGIRRHLNRKTGKLEDCFLPRFAAPEPK